MSTKTTRQKLARALQRVAEDELGMRPALMACYGIIDATPRAEGGIEERACALFETHRETLRMSAERKAERHG